MNATELLKALRELEEQLLSSAGCSHEDALQGGLESGADDVHEIIKKVENEWQN